MAVKARSLRPDSAVRQSLARLREDPRARRAVESSREATVVRALAADSRIPATDGRTEAARG